MSLRSTSRSANLLDELENALAHGTVARRVETLRRVTDLFLYGVPDYTNEQINVFDDVFHCLIEEIETSAKALLANRLAPVPKAPPRLIYTLAFDDEIEVAAPVLSQSERLNDAMLIENARSKAKDTCSRFQNARASAARSPTFSSSAATMKWSKAQSTIPAPNSQIMVSPGSSRALKAMMSLRQVWEKDAEFQGLTTSS
jgi:uncharacterized protein (DUF2336 family)